MVDGVSGASSSQGSQEIQSSQSLRQAGESDVQRFNSSMSSNSGQPTYASFKGEIKEFISQYLKEGESLQETDLKEIFGKLEKYTKGFGGVSKKMMEKMMGEIERSESSSTFSKEDLLKHIDSAAEMAAQIDEGIKNFSMNQIASTLNNMDLGDDA